MQFDSLTMSFLSLQIIIDIRTTCCQDYFQGFAALCRF